MLKKGFYFIYRIVLINFHWIFIYVYRRKVNALLRGGNIVLSEKLLEMSRLLDYHCDKVSMLENSINIF